MGRLTAAPETTAIAALDGSVNCGKRAARRGLRDLPRFTTLNEA
jgi:hypothetical protein